MNHIIKLSAFFLVLALADDVKPATQQVTADKVKDADMHANDHVVSNKADDAKSGQMKVNKDKKYGA